MAMNLVGGCLQLSSNESVTSTRCKGACSNIVLFFKSESSPSSSPMGTMSLRLQQQQQRQMAAASMPAPMNSTNVDKTTLTSFKSRRDGSAGTSNKSMSPMKTGKVIFYFFFS